MKKMLSASLVLLATLFAGMASAAESSSYPLGQRSIFSDRATAERLKPVGSVCVEGEECGSQVAAAEGSGEPRSGEEVYNTGCAACHASGAAGAPKLGDTAAWAPRIDKGIETLVKHAYEGFNAMPAKGMCSNCSEDEIHAAVEYIVDHSK
ncbi:cytochrome c5 [Alcanivorax marinus]|nr:cytochrome c5 [Alloalcanivorax marinus]